MRDFIEIMGWQVAFDYCRAFFNRECPGKETILVDDCEWVTACLFLSIVGIFVIGEDECPAPALDETIVSSIDDSPFYTISELPEGGQDYAKVATTFAGRRFEQAVNILEQYEGRTLDLRATE